MTRTIALSVLICFLLSAIGCTGPQPSRATIFDQAKGMNFNDGVSRNESIVAAQLFVVNNGFEQDLHSIEPYEGKRYFYYIKDGKAEFLKKKPGRNFPYKVNDVWVLFFYHKSGGAIFSPKPTVPFFVEIDTTNGKIIRDGIGKPERFWNRRR